MVLCDVVLCSYYRISQNIVQSHIMYFMSHRPMPCMPCQLDAYDRIVIFIYLMMWQWTLHCALFPPLQSARDCLPATTSDYIV
jgi:hypothetical protein